MSRIFIILALVILLLFIALLFAGNYFYSFSILRKRKEFLKKDPDLKGTASGVKWDSNKEWLQRQSKEELCVESYDKLKLYAVYLPCNVPSHKTIILVHGYNSWSGSMGGFAQYYMELGYNVLMPNLRGHGKSEGSYIGFGWHDRKDLLQWISLAIEKTGNRAQIVLHGVSMGGAAVLMTSSQKLPENVSCIISDCAYSSTADILSYQMRRMFKLPKFPLIYFTSLITKLRAGYFFSEASALKQVNNARLPILFIHGSADSFVPTKMVYELYEAASCPKQILVVEAAAHCTSFWKDSITYKGVVEDFLRSYVE